jgi:hypothetical protein
LESDVEKDGEVKKCGRVSEKVKSWHGRKRVYWGGQVET